MLQKKIYRSPYHLIFFPLALIFVVVIIVEETGHPGVFDTSDFADCVPAMLVNVFLLPL